MAATRIEKDSMGPIDVPADKLWGGADAALTGTLPHLNRKNADRSGACTGADQARSGQREPRSGLLAAERAEAIVSATDEVLADKHADEFPLAIWHGQL